MQQQLSSKIEKSNKKSSLERVRTVFIGLDKMTVPSSLVYFGTRLSIVPNQTLQMDPISGSSGWAGAGLLGLVLAWLLLKHLPSKDQEIKEFNKAKDELLIQVMDRYDRRIDAIAFQFKQESNESRTEFKRTLDSILEHCRKEASKNDQCRDNTREDIVE